MTERHTSCRSVRCCGRKKLQRGLALHTIHDFLSKLGRVVPGIVAASPHRFPSCDSNTRANYHGGHRIHAIMPAWHHSTADAVRHSIDEFPHSQHLPSVSVSSLLKCKQTTRGEK